MLFPCILILLVYVSGLSCGEGNTTETEPVSDNAIEEALSTTALFDPTETATITQTPLTKETKVAKEVQLDGEIKGRGREQRRRSRRPRGYYNDIRFRNRANNPYNPNSPFAFQGRPRPPPVESGGYYEPSYRVSYDAPYYDPYSQGYYGYPVYPQSGYYGYPYQPHPQPQPPQPPPPPTLPPTERNPELYYVQTGNNPDGQYQYKKVSIPQETHWDGRTRRQRATRWPHLGYGQAPPGYYGYSYDPYNRRPYPPQQPYYHDTAYQYQQPPQQQTAYQYQQPPQQQNAYQQYWQQQYSYPRVPGARSRLRTGKPSFRSTALSVSWRLSAAPTMYLVKTEPPQEQTSVAAEQVTEASGD